MTYLPLGQDVELRGRVLYVEDDPVSAMLVQAIIADRYPGVELVHADTGWAGINFVRSLRPDLLLLDMHLPDISGLNVVRELNPEISTGDLSVFLLTADTFSPDIAKAISLGVLRCFIKPLDLKAFGDGLRHFLLDRAEARPAGGPAYRALP